MNEEWLKNLTLSESELLRYALLSDNPFTRRLAELVSKVSEEDGVAIRNAEFHADECDRRLAEYSSLLEADRSDREKILLNDVETLTRQNESLYDQIRLRDDQIEKLEHKLNTWTILSTE